MRSNAVAARAPEPGAVWLGVAVAAFLAAGVAVAAPLLVYSVTLASFGAAHVVSELRYVDLRFGRVLAPARVGRMALLLAGAVSARTLGVLHLLDPPVAVTIELSCVVLLAVSAAGGSAGTSLLAIAVGTALAGATLMAPFDTLITLSVLHNLTPLAFLWEVLPARSRRVGMPMAIAAFVGLPLLVATGVPRAALLPSGFLGPDLDPLGAGPLADHLYIYVPTPLLDQTAAIDLFTGAVVAQGAHYAAVIVVLPLLLARTDAMARGLVAWPRGGMLAALVACVAGVLLHRFGQDFVATRAIYGIAASVHAWIEVPLVVIALTSSALATEREADQDRGRVGAGGDQQRLLRRQSCDPGDHAGFGQDNHGLRQQQGGLVSEARIKEERGLPEPRMGGGGGQHHGESDVPGAST